MIAGQERFGGRERSGTLMRVIPTRLEGPLLIEPDAFEDARGFFLETYTARRYAEAGVDVPFVQDNHSRSEQGTIRGLHYQAGPGQAKLVSVIRGRVWDVVVDIRTGSPTYGEWEAFDLDDTTHRQVFVPVGFAHGFCTLSEADVIYKVSRYYDARRERGIAWNDPQLAIAWPTTRPLLSDRDRSNPPLDQAL
jgi:dTDP-4-dehydrorhamnose 3,5-epimerase